MANLKITRLRKQELEKELKAGENRVVVVNNMRLWDMFHVDGEFQRDGNKVIDKEITNLNAIVTGLLKLINDAKKWQQYVT